MTNNQKGRGFASMDEDRQREIVSQGGKSQGRDKANDPERAREAGKQSHGGGRQQTNSNERDQSGGQGEESEDVEEET